MVITLGLGVWSYLLGKRNQSNFVGTVIPVAYFAVRAILAVMTQTGCKLIPETTFKRGYNE
ncbi:hypothetical protein [Lactiplantibacillus plantarum]|uniref:hypothetical protein n=1 Tax=Lactiplantibacillus plantarum TaxID=1590 RepID=UPI0038B2A557